MPKLVVSASLLAKSQVAQYTRKDGVVVSAYDNGRMAAAPKPAAKPATHTASSLSVLADQHDAEADRHDKLATKKGVNHPDYDHHVDASSMHAKLQYHASKAAAAGSNEVRDAHLAEHARIKKKLSGVEAKISDSAKPAPKVGVRTPAAKKAAPAKTGSEAPAKMVNVGSEKWPLHAKSSEKLSAPHASGSSHHVGGFKAPEYPAGGGATDGDVLIHHEGKTYSFTGKKGKNIKSGEDSYEYSNKDDGDRRAWVTRSGHMMSD